MKSNFTSGNVLIRKVQAEGNKIKIGYQKSQSLKDLETECFGVRTAKYPDVPSDYIVRETFRDNTTKGLAKAIRSFLELRGHSLHANRFPAKPIVTRKICIDNSGQRIYKFVRESIRTDISGKSCIILAAKLTCLDRDIRRNIGLGNARVGGFYCMTSSFDVFLNWYNLNFKP